MAYPASMEVPLIGGGDEGQSRKPRIARSLVMAAGGVVAMVLAGFLIMDPFHIGSADSVPSKSSELSLVAVVAGPVCKPNWCKSHGFEEDACNCGVCGSYGGCSWTCDPTHDEALHRLRSCTSSAWYEYDEVVASFRDPITWFDAAILAFGFLVILFSVIKCKAYFLRAPVTKMADDEYFAVESIVSDSTSARSVGVFEENLTKGADLGDSSSEQSSKDRDVADADYLEQQAACQNISLLAPECQIGASASRNIGKVQSALGQDSLVDKEDQQGNPTIPDFQCQTREPNSSHSCSENAVVDIVQYQVHCQDESKLPELLSHTSIKNPPISPREVAAPDTWKASTQAVLLESDMHSKDLLSTPQNIASAETWKASSEAVQLEALRQDEPVLPQMKPHKQLNDSPWPLSAASRAYIEAEVQAEMDSVVKTLESPRVSKATGHAHALRSRSNSLPRSRSCKKFASSLLPLSRPTSVTKLARGVSPVAAGTGKQQYAWETAASTTCEDPKGTSLLSRSTSLQSTTPGTSLLSRNSSVQSTTHMVASTAVGTVPSSYTTKAALPYVVVGTTGAVGTNRAVTPTAGSRWAVTPPPVASRATTPITPVASRATTPIGDKAKPTISMKSKSAFC